MWWLLGGDASATCSQRVLGKRAFGRGRWAVLAPLGISDCRSHISDLRFEICHLKSQKGTSAASLALPSASPLRVRGLAEQAESTESERYKEPTGPLLSAREVSPLTRFRRGGTGAKG